MSTSTIFSTHFERKLFTFHNCLQPDAADENIIVFSRFALQGSEDCRVHGEDAGDDRQVPGHRGGRRAKGQEEDWGASQESGGRSREETPGGAKTSGWEEES